MKTSSSCWFLAILLARTMGSDPFRNVNCSAEGGYRFEVSVDDLKNEVSVNCRNQSFDAKRVVECAQIRSIDLLHAHSCNLNASVDSVLLRHVKILFLMNAYTEDEFSIRNLNIETLHIQSASVKELRLNDLLLLKNLVIMGMDWKTIIGHPFRELERLMTLMLPYNQLEYLEEDIFYHLRKLLLLNLSGNRLQTLPLRLFQNLERLSYLNLDRNRFTRFNSSNFSKLKGLTLLTLSGNELQEISEDLVASNLELKYIDLSNNLHLNEIPEGLFKNTKKLLVFKMSSCGLRLLAPNVFRSCPLLKEVYLSNNGLKFIKEHTFFGTSLSFLDVSNNSLVGLPNNLLGFSHRLRYLNLSRNHFTNIPSNAFPGMFSLTELNLSYNKIEEVRVEDFDYLTNLQKLDLSNNRISYMNTLGKAKSLLLINLSSNWIRTFPNISWFSYSVENIDLSYNVINDVGALDLSFKTTVTIDLRHNGITSLHLNYTLQNPPTLYLGFNPFICDCSLIKLVEFVQNNNGNLFPAAMVIADVKNLNCHSPISWKDKALVTITSFHLCPVEGSCPVDCRCYQLRDFNVLVNCSSSGKTDFPTVLPPNSTIVHLEDNAVHDFRSLNSKTWAGVTLVYLDRNQLTSPRFWIPPASLKVLSLTSNNLTSLPDDFLKFVSQASSFQLDIRDNPWLCNCSLLPFKRWFMKNLNKLVRSKEILCSRMVNQTTVLSAIQDTPTDAFCAPYIQPNETTQIMLATVLSLTSLMIIFFITFYYRYRETVLAYTYVHVPYLYCCSLSNVDRNKPYDAFVSYTGLDRDTVLTIVEELENKPPYFKLCIHERDWLAGYPITSQIETSVANSKKTIVILTRNFLESFWCETEFQAAYLQSLEDRIDRIIIVVKGDLPEKDTMSLDMQNLLASKTYLVWGERWFWEKLRFALPHYASSVREDNAGKVEEVEGMIYDLKERRCVRS